MKWFLYGVILLSSFIAVASEKDKTINDACEKVLEANCPSAVGKQNNERLICLGKLSHTLKGDCKKNFDAEVSKRNPCLLSTIQLCPKHLKQMGSSDNMFCLAKQLNKVPQACRDIIEKRPRAKDVKSDIRTACKSEYEASCTKGDEATQNKCLDSLYKSGKVSEACKTVLKKFHR